MSDRTSPTEFVVPIAEHLIPSIYEAVESKLEQACDNAWGDATRIRVLEAARLWEGFVAKTLTPQQIAEVALLAVQWIQPHWPKDLEAVDKVEKLLAEARELIELRGRALAAVSVQP